MEGAVFSKGGNMRATALLMIVLVLCGCAASQQTGAGTVKSGFMRGPSRTERAVEEACKTSRNIFYWNRSQVVKEFGPPQEQGLSPKDPSGQTELYTYASGGRIMEVFIKNDTVVDLNYTATGSGVGTGGGRRDREQGYALSLQKIEDAAQVEEPAEEEDRFLKENGIVMEEHDQAIIVYMNGVDEGKGNLFPLREQEEVDPDQYEEPAWRPKERTREYDEELLKPVF
ncbi:MAG: hypothetical protein JW938_04510 [Candidatus Omnitrophica bacterium]|nr:hypothetical protein [Candidatus Omnitrophota bacterium]